MDPVWVAWGPNTPKKNRKNGGEEEGEYEEAAYHTGGKPAGEEPRVEEGILDQPLAEAEHITYTNWLPLAWEHWLW